MTHAIKGVLLSGLVYPGLGQMALKHYLRGLAFLLAATLGLVAVVVEAARVTLEVVAKLDVSRAMVGPDQIYRAVRLALAETNGMVFKMAIALILFSWIVGTVDAFLLGRRMDRARPIQDT